MRFVVARLVALVVVGCHRPPPEPDAQIAFCTDQTALAPTFTNVQRLFSGVCVMCHLETAGLDLTGAVSYGNLISQPAPNYADPVTDESCGGLLVTPGDPAASYLFQKLSVATPCAGAQMPRTDIGTSSPLPTCAQTLVHDWILAGAAND